MNEDTGMLDDKSPAELEQYMNGLGLKFEFSCVKEGDPVSCHSLAQWNETFKRDPEKCAEILKTNCFERKYGLSCMKYAGFKLFGRPNVTRDPLAAFQAYEFGCKSANHGQCCQAAGRMIAEGIASHAPSLAGAIPLFDRGCKRELSESCFHLGAVSITLAQRLDASPGANTSAPTTSPVVKDGAELRRKALEAWLEGCRLGHELSCRNVARMYRTGDGVDVDEAKVKMFTDKADQIGGKAVTSAPVTNLA